MTSRIISAHASQTSLQAIFRDLRELAPVVRVEIEGGLEAWVVTRHAEGRNVLKDPRFIKDLRRLNGPDQGLAGRRHAEDIYAVEGRHMLNSDGAEHQRLRSVVAGHLSARAVFRWLPEIERIARNLVAGLAHDSYADLMSGYARPLPELVMGRVLGFPDDTMLAAAKLSRQLGQREDPASARMRRAYSDFVDLVRDHTREPQQDGAGTVIAALQASVVRGQLSRRELVSTVMMLIGAGISSTANAIGQSAVHLMGTASAARSLLGDEKAATVLVEELLRHDPPFPFSPWRFAREPVELGGVTIPEGAVVLVLLASANRDPDAVASGEDIVVNRPSRLLSLTFGLGPHYCVDANLARVEITLALRVLFGRLPWLRLAVADADVPWDGLLFDRTMTSLPVLTRPA